jgi:hypothetical protein
MQGRLTPGCGGFAIPNLFHRHVALLSLALAVVCSMARAQDLPVAAAPPTASTIQAPDNPAAGEPSAAPTANPPSRPFYHKPFFKRWVSLEAIEATVPAAVLQQVHDWPEEWGKRRSGFEKRIASLYGQFAVGVLIEDGVKAIHPEDTRYHRTGQGNFFKRTAHVIVGTVTAHKPDGSLTMAYSMPANAYGSWAIATLWSPREFRNPKSIFEWGTAGVGAFAGTNFAKEFWPDIRSLFHKKK